MRALGARSALFFIAAVHFVRDYGVFGYAPIFGASRHGARNSNQKRNNVLASSSPTTHWPLSAFLAENQAFDFDKSYVLPPEKVKPILRLSLKDAKSSSAAAVGDKVDVDNKKEKIVNSFGLWCGIVSMITCPLWMMAMAVTNFFNHVFEQWDPNREVYDKIGKIWCKAWLALINSIPTFSGDVDLIKEQQSPCLYVANHASWLDIPVLCTVLDPVFKFIAKGDLTKVPCIGQQLIGGQHILIDREDRRSQLRTFKDGISWLKKGVPIMAFPEGKRSTDGRLMDFKGGLFSMAVKCQVPIVPISISHSHAVFPGYSLLPVQFGAGKLHVHVHDPIDPTGKTESELGDIVRKQLIATLPKDQRPLSMIEEGEKQLAQVAAKAAEAAEMAFKEVQEKTQAAEMAFKEVKEKALPMIDAVFNTQQNQQEQDPLVQQHQQHDQQHQHNNQEAGTKPIEVSLSMKEMSRKDVVRE